MNFYNQSDIEDNDTEKKKVFVEFHSINETINNSIDNKLG